MTLAMHKASKGKNVPWTFDEDQAIIRGVRSGITADAVMLQLQGRTAKAVQGRAVRLGLSISRNEKRAAQHHIPAGLDAEIIKLCSYIKNDSAIANYLGTPVERVAALRKRTPVAAGTEGGHKMGRPREPENWTAIGGDSEVSRRQSAEFGCEALRRAMVHHYQKRARREGGTVEAAMIACLYGRDAAFRFVTTKGQADA